MHHELFFALLGHTGDVVESTSQGFFIKEDVEYVSSAQKEMLNRLLQLGYSYSILSDFLEESNKIPSIYIRGLCQGIRNVLKRYSQKIVDLEDQILKTKFVFTMPKMVFELEEFEEIFPILRRLVKQIIESNSRHNVIRGGRLLELIHQMSISGFPRTRSCMNELLFACHRILYNQILSWVLYGELVDPYQEFFIKKTEIPANNLSDAQLWQKQFVMDLNAIPVSYFPISIAESVFFIGKSMHILLKAEGFSLEEAMEIVETISNISNAPFFDVVRVENAIENIRSKVANLLYKEVVVKSTFVDYMKALKGFFLLSRGEVFQSFIEKSFVLMNGKPTHKSEEELNYTSWHQILQDYQLEDDNMSALFSIKLPLQTFYFKGFIMMDGLVIVGPCVHDKVAKCIEFRPSSAESTSLGALWWRHAQYDAYGFSSSFSMKFTEYTPSKSVALFIHSRPFFVSPVRKIDSNGNEMLILPDSFPRTYLAIQLDILRMESSSEVGILCQVHNAENIFTGEQPRVLSIPVSNSGIIRFDIEYVRMEIGSRKSTKSLLVTANEMIILEIPLNIQDKMNFQVQNGEYYIGLAFEKGIHLTEWAWEKFHPKATRMEGKCLHNRAINLLPPRELWNYLGLECELKWPVLLLMTNDILRSYNHLFQFLFRLKRITFGLQLTWKSSFFRRTKTTKESRNASMLRSKMSFVMQNIQMYFQVLNVESGFTKCQADVEEALDFEKVKRIHDNFIASLVKKCYIHSKTIRSALDDLINCCWKFVEYVIHQDSTGSILLGDRIELITQEFNERFHYFYSVLQHSDARDLVFLLDYNDYFSSESKPEKHSLLSEELSVDIVNGTISLHLS